MDLGSRLKTLRPFGYLCVSGALFFSILSTSKVFASKADSQCLKVLQQLQQSADPSDHDLLVEFLRTQPKMRGAIVRLLWKQLLFKVPPPEVTPSLIDDFENLIHSTKLSLEEHQELAKILLTSLEWSKNVDNTSNDFASLEKILREATWHQRSLAPQIRRVFDLFLPDIPWQNSVTDLNNEEMIADFVFAFSSTSALRFFSPAKKPRANCDPSTYPGDGKRWACQKNEIVLDAPHTQFMVTVSALAINERSGGISVPSDWTWSKTVIEITAFSKTNAYEPTPLLRLQTTEDVAQKMIAAFVKKPLLKKTVSSLTDQESYEGRWGPWEFSAIKSSSKTLESILKVRHH